MNLLLFRSSHYKCLTLVKVTHRQGFQNNICQFSRKKIIYRIAFRGQFHQRSMRSFYVCKLRPQLFCAYVLGLYFTGVSLPAQKLCVERWWNWALVSFCVSKLLSHTDFLNQSKVNKEQIIGDHKGVLAWHDLTAVATLFMTRP